jgi:hypothetical protein
MCQDMLECKQAQYFKFPFLMLLNFIKNDTTLSEALTFDSLKKIVTYLYVYSVLFVAIGGKKGKNNIDKTVINALNVGNSADRLNNVSRNAKTLMRKSVVTFIFPESFQSDTMYAIYSIMDNYLVAENYVSGVYSTQASRHSEEHLLIHQGQGGRIDWFEGVIAFSQNSVNFSATVEMVIMPSQSNLQNKRNVFNLLILPQGVNGELRSYDIVTKIEILRGLLNSLPKHVSTVIEHIESMQSYQELRALKGTGATEEAITAKYNAFLLDYFVVRRTELSGKMREAFQSSFRQ